jgi:hypothetical protein
VDQAVKLRFVTGRAPAIAVLAGLAATGCGDSGPKIDVSGLPRDEYGLQELCPELSHIRGQQARALKRKRQGQLEALLMAYRRNPDAEVRVTFTPADESRLGHETLTVRELVEQNLQTLRELHCSPAAQRRLQSALDEG